MLSVHVQKPKGIIDIFNHLVMKTGKHIGLSMVLLAKGGCTNMYRDTDKCLFMQEHLLLQLDERKVIKMTKRRARNGIVLVSSPHVILMYVSPCAVVIREVPHHGARSLPVTM